MHIGTGISRRKVPFVTKAFLMFVLFDETLPLPNNDSKSSAPGPSGGPTQISWLVRLFLAVLGVNAVTHRCPLSWRMVLGLHCSSSWAHITSRGAEGGPRGREGLSKGESSRGPRAKWTNCVVQFAFWDSPWDLEKPGPRRDPDPSALPPAPALPLPSSHPLPHSLSPEWGPSLRLCF